MIINLLPNSSNYSLSFTARKSNVAELEQKIAKLNTAGYSDMEISKKIGYSYQYTAAIRQRLGLLPPKRIQQTQVEELAKANIRNKEAADTLGISLQWYKQLKRRFGLQRNLPELNEDKVKQMVLEGNTDKEISEYFGGGRLRRIAEIRKSIGKKYKFRKKKTSPSIIERIKFLAAQGTPVKEIAEDIGKSQSWTNILCNRLNIKQNKALEIKAQLEAIFAQGKSVKEAAEILGKKTGAIYYYKNKFKL